jgi:hypothetical protein
MFRRLALILPLAALLHAQKPIENILVENKGAPMSVPFECTQEDTQLAGLTCSDEEPCVVYVELSGIEGVGNRLFVTGNLHTATATLYTLLLASDDAGKTWTEPHPRIRFSGLEQIQFIDFETGWISGANLQSVPRDPFFLITSDGGKTWRERPVFEESRAGVIERFWFESRTTGTMLLDTRLRNRHELYETMTGGESWSVRQVSADPIRMVRGKTAEEQAWRIRPDSKTHSYEIERRQSDRWQSIGSFLVHAGKCKL